MSLVELIAQADERALAAGGLACLDRCVALLGGDDEVLRPLWANLADGSDWTAGLEKARGALAPADSGGPGGPGEDEAALLARRMLDEAPAERTADAVRAWADACSLAALRIHHLLCPATDAGAGDEDLEAARAGTTEDLSPLVAAELRRQTVVLELLAEHGAGGLRRALDVSVEGRRVLRAVVSRRARGRG
ncbi:hypothetical protein AQJ66_13120 [Streptomyces bungoensis]|uniref:Uncharacterized protein n=1 Tax=Streptomyces bungoensis TaxID=285568 RepID=A0A101T5E9_9ACTN|nr:hypothetical protein [Streptomyces bungoensis]KUN85883.1 hypothetical protein AQJ66_13120 [Streptomyces bungoensis]